MLIDDQSKQNTSIEAIKWLGTIIGLTLLFYITARLGLILAIPPGYATSIWLPSGISLAFILLFGFRVAPAIWLGSFLVNYQMSSNLFIASNIALGSTVQALLGAYLVRRFVGFPNALTCDKEIFSFLLLGGPLSCLVAATWGCATIWFANQISAQEILHNWVTWWAGDTIGVLVFTPFILIYTAQPREVWRQRRLSLAIPLCAMFAILIAFFMYTSRWKDEKTLNDFEKKAHELSSVFEKEKPDVGILSKKLVADIFAKAKNENIVMRIYEIDSKGSKTFLYASSRVNYFNGLEWQKMISDHNRQWLLTFTSSPNYLNFTQSWEVWAVPLCGVLLTGLLGALLLSITGKATMIEGVVKTRTYELRLANEALLVEIHRRQEIEASLAIQAKELARSNAELEQFAYIASHDLKEPLRMVVTYIQLLAKENEAVFNKNSKDYIFYAVEGAKRMQAFICDILSYSRLDMQDYHFEVIDSEVILNQVLHNLKILIEEKNATISHSPLPKVFGDKTQLTQLFQNLISNAIKFSNKNQIVIHVEAMFNNNAWLFSVKDNGIGIDPQYFDRIFELFSRLHEAETYQGTGIGLAVCKRIVEQHNGKIWLESKPEQGTTFYFTLPSADKQQKTG